MGWEIAWVNQDIVFNHLISTNQEQSVRAISAIRYIGTNALPVALELCRAKDSWPRKQLVEWVEQYNNSHWPKSFPIHIKPDWEKNSEGVGIIWALGHMAEPAIPALIQLLQSRDWGIAETAMMALPGVGTNAIPSLVQLLASSNQDARVRAATILAQSFASQAHAAVPVLLDCLNVKCRSAVVKSAVFWPNWNRNSGLDYGLNVAEMPSAPSSFFLKPF